MSSTTPPSAEDPCTASDWRIAGLRYFALSHFLRRKFGGRVHKISVDAGLSCPNVDGTVASGGCIFCDNRSFSVSRRLAEQEPRAICAQIEAAVRRLRRRFDCERFIAYFQPSTNTHAPVARLREVYEQALAHPLVVALAVGTRPDCVPDGVLDLLAEIARRRPVQVEYGMQSMHDRSLAWIRRGHRHAAFVDAVERSRGRGFSIGAHVILGLPGETRADMGATALELGRLGIDAVKIHNLYVVKDTPLAEQWQRGELSLMARDTYIDTLIEFLELLPPTMVVERLCGDAPRDFLVAPAWCLDKTAVRAATVAAMERRDTWQGRCWRRSEGEGVPDKE